MTVGVTLEKTRGLDETWGWVWDERGEASQPAVPSESGPVEKVQAVASETVRISGRALVGVLKYAKAVGGPGGARDLIASLPVDARAVFEERIRAGSWYPYRAYAALLGNLGPWRKKDRAESLREFAHWALDHDAGTVLKILSVFSSVEGLVHRGFGSWGGFLWRRHCDAGEVFLAASGDGTASMGLRDFPGIAPVHCEMTLFYLEAMGRAVGATSIRMSKTRCVHRGDPHCEFRGDWS